MVLTAVMLIVGLGGSFLSVPAFAEATSELDSIRDQRAAIKANLTEAESEIADILIELEDLNKEIERVNVELKENQELVDETEKNIDATIDEISTLEEEMKVLEKKIEERYEILKDRMVSTQKSGGDISYLEVIFGSQSFGDFISRLSAVNTIANSDAALIEQQEADMQQVQEKQAIVFDNLDKLNALKAEQEEAKALISQQSKENSKRKETLETKKQNLVALTEELELEDSTLASLQENVKQQIAAEKEREQAEKQAKEEKVKAEPETKVATVQHKPSTKEQENESQHVEQEKEPTSKEENSSPDGKTFSVTATAYTVDSAGGSGITSTGINLKENPDAKVIAVDPKLIPLNSVVYLEGYGYYIAGDTGGAIKGKKIDVFVPTEEEAVNFGVQTINITIVK